MQFVLDPINISVLVVLVLNFSLGIFVLLTNRQSNTNRYFFLFSVAATLWGLSMLFYRSVAGFPESTAFARILYASAATIPYAFLFFIRVFPEEKHNLPVRSELYLLFPFIAALVLALTPNLLIKAVALQSGSEQVIYFGTVYHILFAFYIIIYFSICYGLLFYKYIKFTGDQKQQITYVIVGTFVATIAGVSTNLLMPLLGDFSLNWMGQVGIITMVGAISYSILKHKLFNLKIVATQFIVYALCVSLFIRVLISSSTSDTVVNAIFLVTSAIIGAILIKSVRNEVEQREKVEKLAKDLELANERLKELDQLKSEFLSLATHQIRAPLTAIKGYASMILEGDYGEVSPSIGKAVDIISKSCQSLVVIVSDFLNISRIEQGRMKYELSSFDLRTVVEQVLTELKPNIENASLTSEFKPGEGDMTVYADIGKVKQVIGNLIDNAIKYTPSGGMTLTLAEESAVVRLVLTDTGIGISSEDIPKLFNKFTRAKDANKQNVIGTGLGLYVAKQMIEAQHGSIWLESDGLGKGSRFYMELPKTKQD